MISSTAYRGAPSLLNRVYNQGVKRSVAHFCFSPMKTFCGMARNANFSSAGAASLSIRAFSTQKTPEKTPKTSEKTPALSNDAPLAGIRRSILSGGMLWGGVLTLSKNPEEKLVELAIGGGIAALITICLGRVTGPVARAMNSPEKIDWKKIAIEYSQRMKDPKVELSEYEKLCGMLHIPEDQKNNVALKIIELGLGRAAVYGSQLPLIDAIQSCTDMDVYAASWLASAAVALSEQFLLVRTDAKLALSTLGPEQAVAQRLNVYLDVDTQDKIKNLDVILKERHKELYAIVKLAKHANDNRSIKEILGSDALIEKLGLSQEQVSIYKEAIERLPEPVKDLESFHDQMRELFRGVPYSFSRDFIALLAAAAMIVAKSSLLEKNGWYIFIMGITTVFNNAMLKSRTQAGEFSFVKHFGTGNSYVEKMPLRLLMTGLPLVLILNSRSFVLDWMKDKRADGSNGVSTSPDVTVPTTLDTIENQEGIKASSTSGDLTQTVSAASDDCTSIMNNEEVRALLRKLMDTFMPEMSEVSGKVASMDPAFLAYMDMLCQ